jgi:hypothetical protein
VENSEVFVCEILTINFLYNCVDNVSPYTITNLHSFNEPVNQVGRINTLNVNNRLQVGKMNVSFNPPG